jgi:hypothetical protein
MLQVGLTVQVLGLNVADAFSPRGVEEHQISWEKLILEHFYNAADTHFFPWLLLKEASGRVENLSVSVVLLLVGFMPLDILEEVLDGRYSAHEEQGKQNGGLTSGDRDRGDDLQDHNKEEIDVGQLGELVEQVLWQEVEEGILARSNGVEREPAVMRVLLIHTVTPDVLFLLD